MESWSTCTSKCVSESSFLDQGLPPGFRFHPTDEELVTYYLANKIENPNFACRAVVEADLNKSEPWELPGKALMGEKEWYFYSARDRKYPTGMRTNRATQAGYWKATGKDREVLSSSSTSPAYYSSDHHHRSLIKIVGMKKTLVFYRGRAPKGIKSNWVMHEYRREGHALHATISSSTRPSKDEWVVCRIFHKTQGGKKMGLSELRQSSHVTNIGGALYTASLPALLDSPTPVASGNGGVRSDQETLMLNAFLQYNNNNAAAIKSEPSHCDGRSNATFHDIAIPSMPTQNVITNAVRFATTSRSHIDPHLTLESSPSATLPMPVRGSHSQSSQGEPSLTTIISNTFNNHSKNVSSSTPSDDNNYQHHFSSMHYINPAPFTDPLLNHASTSVAPLSRLPSDLDTYWLYSDRLQ